MGISYLYLNWKAIKAKLFNPKKKSKKSVDKSEKLN